MKYIMHIAGPDDVVEFDTEIEALREANDVNKVYLEQRLNLGDFAPLLVATVAPKDETEAV